MPNSIEFALLNQFNLLHFKSMALQPPDAFFDVKDNDRKQVVKQVDREQCRQRVTDVRSRADRRHKRRKAHEVVHTEQNNKFINHFLKMVVFFFKWLSHANRNDCRNTLRKENKELINQGVSQSKREREQ